VCNGGRVNFQFTGFSIFGNIQTTGCSDSTVNRVSVQLLDSSKKQVASTTSLPEGSYSFSNIKPGDYSIQVYKPSFQFNTVKKNHLLFSLKI
jgi:hypothetical protein